jgi:hypothetical protein
VINKVIFLKKRKEKSFEVCSGNLASFLPKERSTISTVDERKCSVQEDDFKTQPKRKW